MDANEQCTFTLLVEAVVAKPGASRKGRLRH
jgi:hypothetical protein